MSDRNIANLNKDISFEIIRMTEESIREVKEIEIKSGLSPWLLEEYRKEILREDSVCLIAKSKHRVIGFIIARLITQKSDKVSQNERGNGLPGEAEIYNLAVIEQARNKGVGQALFRQFLARTLESEIPCIWLEVRESNYKAIGFYQKNGFIKIQVRKNFYQFPTEDGVLMRLEPGASGQGWIL